MKVVTYICSCGATTDSTKPMLGWAWGRKRVYCPACFESVIVKHSNANVKSSTPPKGEDA